MITRMINQVPNPYQELLLTSFLLLKIWARATPMRPRRSPKRNPPKLNFGNSSEIVWFKLIFVSALIDSFFNSLRSSLLINRNIAFSLKDNFAPLNLAKSDAESVTISPTVSEFIELMFASGAEFFASSLDFGIGTEDDKAKTTIAKKIRKPNDFILFIKKGLDY